MITHVVLFQFAPNTAEADIDKLLDGFSSLPAIIEDILEFRFGRDVIRSERSYDLGLVSSFASLEALQRYQVHPAHQEVVAHAKTIANHIVAVDFEQ